MTWFRLEPVPPAPHDARVRLRTFARHQWPEPGGNTAMQTCGRCGATRWRERGRWLYLELALHLVDGAPAPHLAPPLGSPPQCRRAET